MGAAAVISGLIFGIYHGNLVQAVYASLLGIVFAYILDISGCLWSSVLLHMGANIWSLISPDLYTWIIAKKSTGKIKTSYIAEKSKNYDTNEKLSDEIKSGSFFI